jgi:hypothetical protein
MKYIQQLDETDCGAACLADDTFEMIEEMQKQKKYLLNIKE